MAECTGNPEQGNREWQRFITTYMVYRGCKQDYCS
jgi:hypothetical protein